MRRIFLFLIMGFLLTSRAEAKIETGMSADIVLGQPNFESSTAGAGRQGLNAPRSVTTVGQKMILVDRDNNRILIWNKIPSQNFLPADVVIAQPDFVTTAAGTSQFNISSPRHITTDGQRLFLADMNNNRVLIWNSIPTSNNAPADVVLGQPGFGTAVVNNGGLSARSLQLPQGIFTDGKRLYVVDTSNHRVLIWNKIPTVNFAPADQVLGQQGFATNTANRGGLSARSLSAPSSLFTDGKRMYVTELFNHRLLIWNQIPTANFTAADVVLGQPEFNTSQANHSGLSAKSLSRPDAILVHGSQLMIAEQNNRRILVWNQIPTENYVAADEVIGQPNFTSAGANPGGIGASVHSLPSSMTITGNKFIVADTNNNRVLIYRVDSNNFTDLGPQFSQGKAVVGKVFWDWNGNGRQDGGIS